MKNIILGIVLIVAIGVSFADYRNWDSPTAAYAIQGHIESISTIIQHRSNSNYDNKIIVQFKDDGNLQYHRTSTNVTLGPSTTSQIKLIFDKSENQALSTFLSAKTTGTYVYVIILPDLVDGKYNKVSSVEIIDGLKQ